MSLPLSKWGEYTTGPVQAEFLPDGRRMRLLRDFDYLGPDKTSWMAPQDCIFDGASIPFPFWSIIGGPFEGKYRDASVLHDSACCTRMQQWRAVHLMFYTAMRCSHVGTVHANTMYYAVLAGGPRWRALNPTVPKECLYSPPLPADVSAEIATRLFQIIMRRRLTSDEAMAVARPFVTEHLLDQKEAEIIVSRLKDQERHGKLSPNEKKLVALSVTLSQKFSENEVRRIFEWIEVEKPPLPVIEERAEIARRAQVRVGEGQIFPELAG